MYFRICVVNTGNVVVQIPHFQIELPAETIAHGQVRTVLIKCFAVHHIRIRKIQEQFVLHGAKRPFCKGFLAAEGNNAAEEIPETVRQLMPVFFQLIVVHHRVADKALFHAEAVLDGDEVEMMINDELLPDAVLGKIRGQVLQSAPAANPSITHCSDHVLAEMIVQAGAHEERLEFPPFVRAARLHIQVNGKLCILDGKRIERCDPAGELRGLRLCRRCADDENADE